MIKNILKWIERILSLDLVIAMACMCVLVLLTFLGAIMRYFLRAPFAWQEEVQTWMILWTIFCGSSYAFRKGAYTSIDILTENFSPRMQRVVEWFGYLCTMLALAFFFYYSLKLNIQFYNTNKTTTTLRIASWKINSMVTVGSLWMALSATCYMLRKQLFPEKEAPQ